jgi:hypothetical protein
MAEEDLIGAAIQDIQIAEMIDYALRTGEQA